MIYNFEQILEKEKNHNDDLMREFQSLCRKRLKETDDD